MSEANIGTFQMSSMPENFNRVGFRPMMTSSSQL